MPHDVFVSYSSIDKVTADAVCAYLEARGISCWIAPRDIVAGKDWGEAIIDAINDACIMVLVFSANANTSRQISREVERAASKGVKIIPVRIEDVTPAKSLEYYIGFLHWLDAFTLPVENHLETLAIRVWQMLQETEDEPAVKRPAPMLVRPKTTFKQIGIFLLIGLICSAFISYGLIKSYPYFNKKLNVAGLVPKKQSFIDSEKYYQDGLRQFESGDYNNAIASFNKAIQLEPGQTKVYNNRGLAFYKIGQYQSAIQDYNQVLRVDSQNAEVYHNRGMAYSGSGDYKQAIADYTEAVRIKPDLADAYANRAEAYKKTGDLNHAIQDYNQAMKIKPSLKNIQVAQTYYERGLAYSKNGQLNMAIADYSEAIRLNPSYAIAYNGRGLAFQKLSNLVQAVSDFTQAITFNPKFAEAYCNRAGVQMSLGNVIEAKKDFDRCGKLDPGFNSYVKKKLREAAEKKSKSLFKKLGEKFKKIF